MRKRLALLLFITLLLVPPLVARALSYDVNAPITYSEMQAGESPTTDVTVSWDDTCSLTYKWTDTGSGWKWIPFPAEVIFTITNNSVCNDATVSATLSSVSYGDKTAAAFGLENASIGLATESTGPFGDSASTGALSGLSYNESGQPTGAAGVGHLYYAIQPAEGAGLTPDQMSALGPAAVTATIAFRVTMNSSAYETGE